MHTIKSALMERTQQVGLTFNNKKGMIRQPKISFFGVLYSKNGVNLDPKKIQGILEMQGTKFLFFAMFSHNPIFSLFFFRKKSIFPIFYAF